MPRATGFPGFDTFFKLDYPPSSRVYGCEIDLEGWRATRTRHPPPNYDPLLDDAALFHGDAVADRPILVRHVSGLARPSDVIWTTAPIVGPRVLAVLRDGGFTGWDTWPVEVRDRDDQVVPGYAGLVVKGRCGPWDLSSCEEVVVDRKVMVRGFRFDPESWDGTDLFLVAWMEAILCTERLASAMRRARFRNVRLVRLTEWAVSKTLFAGLREPLAKAERRWREANRHDPVEKGGVS